MPTRQSSRETHKLALLSGRFTSGETSQSFRDYVEVSLRLSRTKINRQTRDGIAKVIGIPIRRMVICHVYHGVQGLTVVSQAGTRRLWPV